MTLNDLVTGANNLLSPIANSAPVRAINQLGIDTASRNIVNPIEQGISDFRKHNYLSGVTNLASGAIGAVTPPNLSDLFNINNPTLALGVNSLTMNPKSIVKSGLNAFKSREVPSILEELDAKVIPQLRSIYNSAGQLDINNYHTLDTLVNKYLSIPKGRLRLMQSHELLSELESLMTPNQQFAYEALPGRK